MAYVLTEEQHGFLITFSGFIPPGDALNLYRRIVKHPVSQEDSYQIQDFTGVDGDTVFTMSDSIIEGVAERLWTIYGNHEPRLYLAMVTSLPKVRDFIKAVWTTGAHPPHHRMKIFRDVQSARDWVNGEMGIAR